MKKCSVCKQVKSLDHFHRQPNGTFGRSAYCASCANERRRVRGRNRQGDPLARKHALWNRYRLRPEDVARMREQQGDVCAICKNVMIKACIDHCHSTGKVRGILCHKCNIKLGAIEDTNYLNNAKSYLLNPPAEMVLTMHRNHQAASASA